MPVQDAKLYLNIKRHKDYWTWVIAGPGNLFDVERDHQCDSSYQRQQRAVVDSQPGHCLTVNQIQDVEWDQEALFPRQPGQQGWGVLLLQ